MIKSYLMMIKGSMVDSLRIRRRPQMLQLPITNRCNSRCVTCNVWKNNSNPVDIDPIKLREAFKDPYFSRVGSVGLNGGEFTLFKNIDELIDAVLTLPNLHFISLISNALLPDRLIERLRAIYPKVKAKGVTLAITLSIDGVEDVQVNVRGVKTAWERSKYALEYIKEHREELCDIVNVGCTISKYNVEYLPQVDSYLQKLQVPVEFHLAVPNKRIGTFNDSGYSVLNDERSRILAIEFFYKKFIDPSETRLKKIRYFMQIEYLKKKGSGRMASCSFLYKDVTIDENLKMYLCATASDEIGNLSKDAPKMIFRSKLYKSAVSSVRKQCDTCIHYVWYPTTWGLIRYVCNRVHNKFLIPTYRLLLKCKIY